MRAYFFGNMYLSSIQQGIQALHCLGEMHNKYDDKYVANDVGKEYCRVVDTQLAMLRQWEEEHKTVVLLNAGFSSEILDLYEFFADGVIEGENYFPFAMFNEGQDALEGATTCVGIVLPEHIYEGARAIRSLNPRKDPDAYVLWRDFNAMELELNGEVQRVEYTQFERDLMQRMNTYRLAQ